MHRCRPPVELRLSYGSTSTQRNGHADASTASGFSERTNHNESRKEGPQGRNASVNPLALRRCGTIIRPFVFVLWGFPLIARGSVR